MMDGGDSVLILLVPLLFSFILRVYKAKDGWCVNYGWFSFYIVFPLLVSSTVYRYKAKDGWLCERWMVVTVC
jgi:hypothetical protein